MATDIVLVEDLTVSYKNVRAINNVSFSVKQGEILAIIGPNGSGKTSTVECIEGLRKPDHGSIQVFGKSPREERSEIYKLMGVQLQETEYPSKIRVDEQCKLFASFSEKSVISKATPIKPMILLVLLSLPSSPSRESNCFTSKIGKYQQSIHLSSSLT